MPKSTTVEGLVAALNISPHGDLEGVLVTTKAGTVQVNFEKKANERAATWPIGGRVRIAAELEEDGFSHPVYRFLQPGAGVEGEVVRLNYARHGEVNGYILSDGLFIHVKPDGAKGYRVKVGDRIRASGERRHGNAADVIEAVEVVRLRPAPRAVAS